MTTQQQEPIVNKIHHINFLVHDLDQAVQRYQVLFGESRFQFDQLEQRAVKTARIKVGETWFVLLQPIDEDSIPAKHLRENGEGFFLLSFGTDNLDKAKSVIESQLDSPFATPERKGLDNWHVLDLQMAQFFNVQVQLTEER